MFRNILVGLDGSTHGSTALTAAIDLAHRLGAQLHGVHVLDTSLLRGPLLHDFSGSLGLGPQMHLTGRLETFMATRAEELLQGFEERCRTEGVRCTTSSRTGAVAEVLAELAELQDLVVIGKRGASYDLKQEPGRNTTHQLLRLCPAPLLAVGNDWSPITRALVAFDGSPGAHRALKDAAALASALNIGLTLAYVREGGSSERAEPAAEAQRYLEPYHLDVRFVSRSGVVVPTLRMLVEEEQANLLVVGYQGTSRLRELFVGHAPDVLMGQVSSPLWVSR